MTGIPSAGTDLSREILDNVLGKQPREPASDPERPAAGEGFTNDAMQVPLRDVIGAAQVVLETAPG